MNSISNKPPSEVRLSANFLLSDFMGCNSVYTKGYPNVFHDPSGKKLKEGVALCEYVLEALLEQYGQLSISYGYISPDLSEEIVTYMDPGRPSYHRWDKGAACDVLLHDPVNRGEAPVYSAFRIDEELPMSRVISYSESPYICLATNLAEIESGKFRRALYENRYIGQRKPQYIPYPSSLDARAEQVRAHTLTHDWRGAGYPTYHGGGKRQLHHVRTSKYTMLSDWLYSDEGVRKGCRNVPPRNYYNKFRAMGDVYDTLVIQLLHEYGPGRLPIIEGYSSPEYWEDKGAATIALPDNYEPDGLFDTLQEWGDNVANGFYDTQSHTLTFAVNFDEYERM